MLPDRVSNPGPLTYESGALPIALRGPAKLWRDLKKKGHIYFWHSDYELRIQVKDHKVYLQLSLYQLFNNL